MTHDTNTKALTSTIRQGGARLFIATFALSVLVAAITVDMVNPVLPILIDQFETTKAEVSWVVSGVALMLAFGVPLYGRMSDVVELKKLFLIAVCILALGSLICALARDLIVLVVGRMVQGAGMSAIPVLSIVAVSKVFPPGKRGGVLGIMAGCIGVGTAGGPIFGGMIGSMFALPKLEPLPEGAGGRRFDLLGGVLLGLSAGMLLLGVTLGESSGFGSLASLSTFACSLLALAGFIRRITIVDNPFVPPALFANRYYVCSILVSVFSMFAYFAVLVFVPLLVAESNGLTPGEAGLVLLPGGAAVALLSPWIGRISDRVGTKRLILAGVSLMGVSTLFLSTYAAGSPPAIVSVGVLGAGIAFALTNSPANSAAVSSLSKEEVGVGIGIYQGALYLGAGTGAGIIGAVLSSRRTAGDPLNPLYTLSAIPYSDAFLVTSAALIVALIAGLGLRNDSIK
ncbi:MULTISPECIES: MFS transporter [Paenibacillus]|uniref:Major facilitator superfamily MFS_1 n=1 Tax=Paenibacillus lactis 154 TaxID=743719 RepID=G4HAL6_9BACL|nr:MFS transporter [Paenibacillus lactis]EHB66975.1 major facilitator superfamily MFS_1 [Paenibacillus lactis 154]